MVAPAEGEETLGAILILAVQRGLDSDLDRLGIILQADAQRRLRLGVEAHPSVVVRQGQPRPSVAGIRRDVSRQCRDRFTRLPRNVPQQTPVKHVVGRQFRVSSERARNCGVELGPAELHSIDVDQLAVGLDQPGIEPHGGAEELFREPGAVTPQLDLTSQQCALARP